MECKDSLGGGGVGDVMWCGTVGKEEPGEVGCPVRGGAAGSECGFEGTVKALYHPVGLQVIGGGGDVVNLEELADL